MLERGFLMQMTVVGTCPFPSLPPHGVHPSRYEVVKRGYAKCFGGWMLEKIVLYWPLHSHSHLHSQAF